MVTPGRRLAKRIVIAIVGGTVTLAGMAMIVLPGPAIVVIPLGLSILATEFTWARRYLRKCRTMARGWKNRLKNRTARAAPSGSSAMTDVGDGVSGQRHHVRPLATREPFPLARHSAQDVQES